MCFNACALSDPDVGPDAREYALKSPDGQVSASFELKKGTLYYSVTRDGTPVVSSSKVEIFPGAKIKVLDHSVFENDSSWEPVWGQFSSIRDHHRELSLSLKADGIPLTMLCRVFDKGLGFRFVMSEESEGKQMTFTSQSNIPGNVLYYSPQGKRLCQDHCS